MDRKGDGKPMNNGNGTTAKVGMWAAVIFGAVGTLAAFIVPIYGTLGDIRNDGKQFQENFADLIAALHDDGKAAAEHKGRINEKLKSLAASVNHLSVEDEKMDERLQREMRMLVDTTEAKLNEYDRRIQGELQTTAITINSRLDTTRGTVDSSSIKLMDLSERLGRLEERVELARP